VQEGAGRFKYCNDDRAVELQTHSVHSGSNNLWLSTRAEPTNGLSSAGGFIKSLATSEDEAPVVAAADEPFGFSLAACLLACRLEGLLEGADDIDGRRW
jgi:hypothetical protein